MVERLERYEKPAHRHCKTEKWSIADIACAYESTITGKDGTILLPVCDHSVQLNNLMRTFYRSLVKSIKVIVLILRLKFKTETYHISNRA